MTRSDELELFQLLAATEGALRGCREQLKAKARTMPLKKTERTKLQALHKLPDQIIEVIALIGPTSEELKQMFEE